MTHLSIIQAPTGSSMLLDYAINAYFQRPFFLPFGPASRVLIPQMHVWYQWKGFLMLYKNYVASLYEKFWSKARKWSKRMLEMNKMAAGRHLEFDTLVPPAHACASGSLFRTPWATSVPNFSSSLQKKNQLSFLESFCNLAGQLSSVFIRGNAVSALYLAIRLCTPAIKDSQQISVAK